VGWFTALYPVLLDLEGAGDAVAALKSVKEQLRAVPGHGISYGLLRYLEVDDAIMGGLRSLPQAELSFLYLGRFDLAGPESKVFGGAKESTGPLRSARGRRRHLLEVSSQVSAGRLRVSWIYSENLHRRSTIEGLAESFLENLRLLISRPVTTALETHTASDFPGARLDQRELEEFLSTMKRTGSAPTR
jgi:non-ribosomal peptide synthase protein (TIGR01720 family)